MLLQDLHDSHVCNSLLVAESEEDIWKNESHYTQKLNTSDGASGENDLFFWDVFVQANMRLGGGGWFVIIWMKGSCLFAVVSLACVFCHPDHRLQHRGELPCERLPSCYHAVHPRTLCLWCGVEHNHSHPPPSQDGTQHGGVQGWVADVSLK